MEVKKNIDISNNKIIYKIIYSYIHYIVHLHKILYSSI